MSTAPADLAMLPFLSGGGEMGALMRAHDWASTPLGRPEGWPQPLKTLVGLMHASRQPMFMAWGAAQTWLYNDAFVPILGDKHPRALGRPALAEVWSEAHAVLAPLFARVFGGESVHMDDFGLMLERHGRLEEAHFAFSYTPVREDSGAVAGLFGVCIETTPGIRMQEELRETHRRKDEFLATLAHELRNPLAPLRNALFLTRHPAKDPAKVDALQQMMERQVDQLVRLVDDLLDVSRISQGKIVLRTARVEVNALLDTALEATASTVREAGQAIEVRRPAGGLHLQGDAVRLNQVLCNLIHNAVKFSARGGVIELAAAREGDEIVLRVRDQGVGIPADKLETVFEMFSQLEGALDRAKSGLGLGLPLARKLVQLHGGTICAFSAGEQRGSEFVVRLPLETRDEAGPRR
jgi:signal transduction histidine kinase